MSEANAEEAPKRSIWAAFRATVTNESFLEKIILLVLTAILSGLAVPVIVTYINAQSVARQKEEDDKKAAMQKAADQAKADQQKVIDEHRARQEALVQSQSRLLLDFSDVVLSYATLALDVSWFGSDYLENRALQERALARYS